MLRDLYKALLLKTTCSSRLVLPCASIPVIFYVDDVLVEGCWQETLIVSLYRARICSVFTLNIERISLRGTRWECFAVLSAIAIGLFHSCFNQRSCRCQRVEIFVDCVSSECVRFFDKSTHGLAVDSAQSTIAVRNTNLGLHLWDLPLIVHDGVTSWASIQGAHPQEEGAS